MKIAFIQRSTLYNVPGGDTIQVTQTARHLRKLGLLVDIYLTNASIPYHEYDLFHFANINRPADILFHINRIDVPFFVSPVLVNYSEFDKHHRKGFSGMVLRYFSAPASEYIKTMVRWLRGKDVLQSKQYIWKGQKKSIREIVKKATAFLPNSAMEYNDCRRIFGDERSYAVIPNGIDERIFTSGESSLKDNGLIICAARIEGIKNQLNLIRAVNNTAFRLLIIGSAGPNHQHYYETCRKTAASNISFIGHLPQEELIAYYKKAKVHVLPSWFETCGLSSLEAAAAGCNIVITEKGYTRDYFGNDAFYCDPADPGSIIRAITAASETEYKKDLGKKIIDQYTWEQAARLTLEAYKKFSYQ